MEQKGFFDFERMLEAISAKGDPLETIKKIVPWENFRTDIEAVLELRASLDRSAMTNWVGQAEWNALNKAARPRRCSGARCGAARSASQCARAGRRDCPT
jgi:hypothetical protein